MTFDEMVEYIKNGGKSYNPDIWEENAFVTFTPVDGYTIWYFSHISEKGWKAIKNFEFREKEIKSNQWKPFLLV